MHTILFTTLALFGALSAADSSEKDNESWLRDIMYPCSNNFNLRSKDCAERGISEGNVGGWPRFKIDGVRSTDTHGSGKEYECRGRFFTGDPVTKYNSDYLNKTTGKGTGGNYDLGKYTYKRTVCDYATEMNAHCQPLSSTSLFDYDAWVTYSDRKDTFPDIDRYNNGEPWFQVGGKTYMYADFIESSLRNKYISEDPHVDVVHEHIENDAGGKDKWIVVTCADGYTGTGARIAADDLTDYTLQYLYDRYDNPMIFKLDFVNWVVENTNCQPE